MNTDAKPPRFDRAARLIGVTALFLLLASIGQVVYRATLPTLGWAVLSDEAVGGSDLLFSNLVGAASGLQEGDVMLAVDGVSISGAAAEQHIPVPAGWRKGGTVTMTVQRGSATLDVAAPVVGWTPLSLWRYITWDPAQVASLAGALLFLALGWFTFWRRPGVPSARALLVFSTAEGATFISGLVPVEPGTLFDLPAFLLTAFFSFIIFGTMLAPALLTFTLLFPQPRQAIRRRPWLALLPHAYGLLLFVLLFSGAPGEIGWFSTLGMLALSLLALAQGWFTQRDPVSRAQLRWAIGGLVSGILLFALNFPLAFNWVTAPLLTDLMYIAQSFGIGVIGSGLAIAVLRYRLYDIDIIIRKTLQYAAITALLALVYFGSVVTLQTLFGRLIGEESPLVIVLSTLLIAALFTPLRRRVQAFIDRRFYRRKVDAARILARFAATARDEVALERLQAAMLDAVQRSMEPAIIATWLAKPAGGRSRRPAAPAPYPTRNPDD